MAILGTALFIFGRFHCPWSQEEYVDHIAAFGVHPLNAIERFV